MQQALNTADDKSQTIMLPTRQENWTEQPKTLRMTTVGRSGFTLCYLQSNWSEACVCECVCVCVCVCVCTVTL